MSYHVLGLVTLSLTYTGFVVMVSYLLAPNRFVESLLPFYHSQTLFLTPPLPHSHPHPPHTHSPSQRILPDGSLEIFQLSPDDAGEYMCRLANAAGEVYLTVNVIVRGTVTVY